MKSIFSNFKVSVKLALISATFILPILVLLYFLTSEQNIRIDFAQKELYGNQYLRPLKNLLELGPAYSFENKYNNTGSSANELQNKIEKQFTVLEETDKELTGELKTTSHLDKLKEKWNLVKGNPSDTQLHKDFETEIRQFISYVGDVSNLILDPDLDSYYIMDATLLKLPENMSLIYKIMDYGQGIVIKGTHTSDEKTELIVQTGLLKTNAEATNSGINVAFNNNPANNLRSSLNGNLNETIKATNEFLDKINLEIINKDEIKIPSSEYVACSQKALNLNFKLWDDAINSLDLLLQARIDGFNRSKYLTLAAIVGAILLTLGFVIIISKNITRSIHALSTAAKEFSEGKTDAKVDIQSKDELGKLAGVFNEMMGKTNEYIAFITEEKGYIEHRVEEAVKESNERNQYLTTSVDTMLQGIQKFARGDLTIQLAVEKDDEIGKLYKGFNKAVSSIKTLIDTVSRAVAATVDSSTRINSNAEEIFGGIREQANQTSEVSAAISQMATTIIENARNVSMAVEYARKAGTYAAEGGDVVKSTIDGMGRIETVVTHASATVEELGKNSQEIGEIIQVIEDIADQTNMLALNAAIEAARAGDLGRGFAVVADEVKKLADRTTKATKEITDMIVSIQKETTEAVQSILQGNHEVEHGKKSAVNAGKTLSEIINASNEVVDVITQVAAASEEQSTAAEQVSTNISNINNVVHSSEDSIQHIVNATGELNQLTHNLQKLVSKFKINTGSMEAVNAY
jgi:methyl-accepting chemotaxis protein